MEREAEVLYVPCGNHQNVEEDSLSGQDLRSMIIQVLPYTSFVPLRHLLYDDPTHVLVVPAPPSNSIRATGDTNTSQIHHTYPACSVLSLPPTLLLPPT